MYKFSIALFIVSTTCIFLNIILIIADRYNVNHYIRACTFVILSFSSYYLMKYYKEKNNRK